MPRQIFSSSYMITAIHAASIHGFRDIDGKVCAWISIKNGDQFQIKFVYSLEQARGYLELYALQQCQQLVKGWDNIFSGVLLPETTNEEGHHEIKDHGIALFIFSIMYLIIDCGVDNVLDFPDTRPHEWREWGKGKQWFLATSFPEGNQPVLVIEDPEMAIMLIWERESVERVFVTLRALNDYKQRGESLSLDRFGSSVPGKNPGEAIVGIARGPFKKALFYFQALVLPHLEQ